MSIVKGPTTELERLFADHRIRVRGTVVDPLIGAADLAARIGDRHYTRTLRGYGPSYLQRMNESDSQGRTRQMLYLTEVGAYKYLLQSKQPAAEPFQLCVYNLIKAERARVVDAAQLAQKIDATEKAAHALERAETHLAVREAELAAFDKRWGPTAEEAAYMGVGPSEDDWGSAEE